MEDETLSYLIYCTKIIISQETNINNSREKKTINENLVRKPRPRFFFLLRNCLLKFGPEKFITGSRLKIEWKEIRVRNEKQIIGILSKGTKQSQDIHEKCFLKTILNIEKDASSYAFLRRCVCPSVFDRGYI